MKSTFVTAFELLNDAIFEVREKSQEMLRALILPAVGSVVVTLSHRFVEEPGAFVCAGDTTVKPNLIPSIQQLLNADSNLLHEYRKRAGGSFAYNMNLTLYILLCCESIRWMHKHGLTDTAASAVASFAMMLVFRKKP